MSSKFFFPLWLFPFLIILAVQISIYPTEENTYEGRDATFNCRVHTADRRTTPEVRWTRHGVPMPETAREFNGQLKFSPTKLSDSGRYICTVYFDGKNYDASAQLNVQSCKY